MRTSLRSTAPAVIVAVAALLLTGCGEDDGADGAGSLGLETTGGTGGGSEDGAEGGEGGEGSEGGEGEGSEDGGSAGGAGAGDGVAGGENPFLGRWEGEDVVMVLAESGGVYAIPSSGAVCTTSSGPMAGLDWVPMLFSCGLGNDPSAVSVTVRLNGDTAATLEYSEASGRDPQDATRVEDLNGEQVDLDAVEESILD